MINKIVKMIPINDLNKITSQILSDRKNSNKIVDLIDLLINIDDPIKDSLYCQSLVQCLTKIFTSFIDQREMILFQIDDEQQQFNKINTYKSWLIKLYEKIQKIFIEILENENSNYSMSLRKIVLKSLIKFVEEEGKFPFRSPKDENETSFPVIILSMIIKALCSKNVNNQELIELYSSYYQYQDVIHHTMNALLQIIDSNRSDSDSNENLISNIFNFIHPIRLITPDDLLPKSLQESLSNKPEKKSKNLMRLCELQKHNDDGPKMIPLPIRKFKFNYERDASIYFQLWLKFLSFQSSLPPLIYKRSLIHLDKHALQHFAEPLYFADFLIQSFEKGGIISLLSLSPLYTLMHKCNLEYPNFFGQLYQLLEPAITYKQHRSRFLFWCDLFLTSTHIPATIVASFVKKFARLSIRSTPDTIVILLKFISNLLIRHPLIKRMLEYKEFDPSQDLFDENEKDPEKTRAIDSYLWELNMLQSHYYPEIVEISKQIFLELPRYECKLEDILETYLDDIIEKQVKQLQEQKLNKLTYDIDCDLYKIIYHNQ